MSRKRAIFFSGVKLLDIDADRPITLHSQNTAHSLGKLQYKLNLCLLRYNALIFQGVLKGNSELSNAR